jgi:hypothetical protein
VVLHDVQVERLVGLRPGGTGERCSLVHRRVQRCVVVVGEVDVVRILDRPTIEEHVDVVERIEVVSAPAGTGHVEVDALRAERLVVDAARHEPVLRLEADLLHVVLGDLSCGNSDRAPRVVHGERAGDRCAADLLGLRNIRTLDGVQMEVAEAGDPRDEDLVGALAGVLAEQANGRRPVETPLDSLAGCKVVQRCPRRVHRPVEDARRRTDVELLLVDAELRAEVGVRRRRRTARVDVHLAGLDLEQTLILVGVDRPDDLVGVRRPRALVVRVAHFDERLADVTALDVVRAGRRLGQETRLTVRRVRLDRAEPLHRSDRDEGRVRLHELDDERLPLGGDTRDMGCLAREEVRTTRDDLVQLDVDADRRAHLRAQVPLERPLEGRGRHRGAVAELEARANREGVGLSVLRDGRERGRALRIQLATLLAVLLRVVHEQDVGRIEHRPAERVVCQTLVRELEVVVCDVDLERSALLGHLPGDAVRVVDPREGGRREEQCPDGREHGRKHEFLAHWTPSLASFLALFPPPAARRRRIVTTWLLRRSWLEEC